MMLDETDLDLVLESLEGDGPPPGADILGLAPSCIWLGSGLAKISAFHGASLVGRFDGKPSRTMTPLEYCQTRRARCLPVLLTLRGRNEDATGLAAEIVARRAPQALALTGDETGEALSFLAASGVETRIATTKLPEPDRRFVNCRGIFVLSALASRLARSSLAESVELRADRLVQAFRRARAEAERLAERIASTENWRGRSFFILSDGAPSELSVAWASILAEAGIVNPICADLKDFTHGDHIASSLRESGIFILLRHARIGALCDVFSARFATLFPLFEIDLETDGAEIFWENLFYACNMAAHLSFCSGYQGGRPPKHPVVHAWRGWGDIRPEAAQASRRLTP